MPDKKTEKKAAPAKAMAATKSSHDALVKRVSTAEAQINGIAQRLNIDLSEFDS